MSFRTLDLNLLRVFDVVMDERNLTRAATRLAMTQPAVSNALKRLREAVGVELFARSARGVTPTADAETLWPAVRDALAGLREALDPQDFDPRTDARSFRIATRRRHRHDADAGAGGRAGKRGRRRQPARGCRWPRVIRAACWSRARPTWRWASSRWWRNWWRPKARPRRYGWSRCTTASTSR